MISIHRILTVAIAVTCVTACAGKEKDTGSQERLAADPANLASSNSSPESTKVTWSGEKLYDLTGDGIPERLSVRAFGPSQDSLLVVLEIYGRNNKLLYRDRWSSERYFAYDYRAGKADTTVARIVLGHLNRLLSDSSFILASATGPRAIIDTMTIRYDLAEWHVRQEHALQDTSTLSTSMFDEIEKVVPPKGEVDRIANDVKSLPRFTYFAGGELTYTLAWSEALQRFVRVFSCC